MQKEFHCKCQGLLEYFAQSEELNGLVCGDGSIRTSFYSCNRCDTVYELTRENTEPDTERYPTRYNGDLTKSEIKEHALTFRGDIGIEDEQRIIALRRK